MVLGVHLADGNTQRERLALNSCSFSRREIEREGGERERARDCDLLVVLVVVCAHDDADVMLMGR